jgi:hypothetical protein
MPFAPPSRGRNRLTLLPQGPIIGPVLGVLQSGAETALRKPLNLIRIVPA